MLPDISGFDICETIRLNDSSTPILFLTAKSDSEDRIKGLSIGGDDYLTKPFNIEELLLRIKLLIKRSSPSESSAHELVDYKIGSLEIRFNSFEVVNGDGVVISLTKKANKFTKVVD